MQAVTDHLPIWSREHSAPAAESHTAPAATTGAVRGPWEISRLWAAALLILLTAFGGVIRFYWIDKPSLWNDEAHTYRRVTQSFQVMLDHIQGDGFAPLHYEAYWALGHWNGAALLDPVRELLQCLRKGTVFSQWLPRLRAGEFTPTTDRLFSGDPATLTPFWMRLIPSLAGTLMVPAMYFLARQLSSRRVALVAAAFAASSAYLMAYSHDAKMYMPFWLFCALNVGSLLWWFNTGRRIAWLAWIASGLAMGGTNAIGLVILGLQPLMLLTIWRPSTERIRQRLASLRQGAAGSLALSASAWGRLAGFVALDYLRHWRRFLLFAAGMAVIVSGPAVHYLYFNRWQQRVGESGWSASGLAWVPPVVQGRDGRNAVLFVTSALMYSWEWPGPNYRDDPRQINSNGMFNLMLQGVNIDAGLMTALKAGVVLVLILAAIGALPWSARLRGQGPRDPPTAPWWRSALWLSVWMIVPAYGFYVASFENHATPGYWLGAVNSFVGDAFHNGASTVAAAVLPGFVAGWISSITVNHVWCILIPMLIVMGVTCILWRPLAPLFAGILGLLVLVALHVAVFQSGVLKTSELLWWQRVHLFGQHLADVLTRPALLLAALMLLPPAVWYYCGRDPLARCLRLLGLAAIVALVLCLCWAVDAYFTANPRPADAGPIWMPRYVAFIWPAMAVALAILFMRLPTRTLRIVAISIFIGANLAQSWGRMFAGSEPPVDLIVADVWATQDPNGPARAYVAEGSQTAHPAGGTIENRPGKYYASIASGIKLMPQDFVNQPITRFMTVHRPASILSDVQRMPQLRRIIVWDRVRERPRDADPAGDDLLRQLGPDWRMEEAAYFPVRYHWNWSYLYTARRREYVKQTPPPQRPMDQIETAPAVTWLANPDPH